MCILFFSFFSYSTLRAASLVESFASDQKLEFEVPQRRIIKDKMLCETSLYFLLGSLALAFFVCTQFLSGKPKYALEKKNKSKTLPPLLQCGYLIPGLGGLIKFVKGKSLVSLLLTHRLTDRQTDRHTYIQEALFVCQL